MFPQKSALSKKSPKKTVPMYRRLYVYLIPIVIMSILVIVYAIWRDSVPVCTVCLMRFL